MRCSGIAFAAVLCWAQAAAASCPATILAPPGSSVFGTSVALTGDLNSDGFNDWAVGAAPTTGTDPGHVYVFFGGSPRNATPDITLTGGGNAIAGIGDWNGDGRPDLAVGAPFDDTAGTDAGRVYVYYGDPAFDALPDVILNGPVPGARLGSSLAGGADLNQDGRTDLVVGAPGVSLGGFEGQTYIYYGAASPPTIPSLAITGAISEQLGTALAIGDFNGDGQADLAAGAPGSSSGARVKMFWGGALIDNAADRLLVVGGVGSGFGQALAAGDVNGDLFSDLVAGAPTFGNNVGAAYVFYGGPSSDEFPDLTLAQGLPAGNFGRAVAAGGDVNGDGLGDFIVTVPGREMRIYYGGAGVDNVPDRVWLTEQLLDGLGQAVTIGPETDSAGPSSEILAGAPQNGAGRAYLDLPVCLVVTAPTQLSAAAGASVPLHFCVRSCEAGSGNYTVHAADSAGWLPVLDSNQTIAPGDSVCFDLTATAGADVSCTTVSTITISVIPSGCLTAAAVKTVNFVRTTLPPVVTACALQDTFPNPGEAAVLDFCFQNPNASPRNFVYEFSGGPSGCGTNSATVTVPAGATYCVSRSCSVPLSASCGTAFTMTARVREQCNLNGWVSCTHTGYVTSPTGFTVTCAPDTIVDQGQTIQRLFRFTNAATVPMGFNYSATDNLGWGAPQTGTVTVGAGQTQTVHFVLTTPATVCTPQIVDTIQFTVSSPGCPAQVFQCTSKVTVPLGITMLCPPDTSVGGDFTLQRRLKWKNTTPFTRSFDYQASDSEGWGPPVSGTVVLGPGQTGSAILTLAVPSVCTAASNLLVLQVAEHGCAFSTYNCTTHVNKTGVAATLQCPADFIAPSLVTITRQFWVSNQSATAESFVVSVDDALGWVTPVSQPLALGAFQSANVSFTMQAPLVSGGQTLADVIECRAEDLSCNHVTACTAQALAGSVLPAQIVMDGTVNEVAYGEPLVASADLSGDAVGELLAGAQSIVGNIGRMHLEYGGLLLDGTPERTTSGENTGDGYASVLAAPGDLNSDGFADVVVGAPFADVAGPDAGRAYVYFGGPEMDAIVDRVLNGSIPNMNFAGALAGPGDVNGDGKPDLLVGLPGSGGGNGFAFVYFGGFGFDTSPDRFLSGSFAGERFGQRLAGAGDVNGDGFFDILVGAPSNDSGGTDFGAVYVFFGGPALDATVDLVLHGDGGRFGDAISSGDFDGDGRADIVVGAPLRGTGGRVYVFRGGAGVLDAVPDWTFDSAVVGEHLGTSVSCGDLDHDGITDLVAGSLPDNPATSPRVLVFRGGAALEAQPDVTLFGLPGTRYGATIGADRDVTGDAYPDLAIGASNWPDHGRVFLYTQLSFAPTGAGDPPPVAEGSFDTFLGQLRDAGGAGIEVSYGLGAAASGFRLDVFDIAGRHVRSLAQGARAPGRYMAIWNRRDDRGTPVSRGVYLVRMEAGDFRAGRKSIVLQP